MATAEARPISIKMSEEILQHLRQVARWESFERHTDVTYSDLIREAVLATYPMPKESHEDEED